MLENNLLHVAQKGMLLGVFEEAPEFTLYHFSAVDLCLKLLSQCLSFGIHDVEDEFVDSFNFFHGLCTKRCVLEERDYFGISFQDLRLDVAMIRKWRGHR